MLIFLQTTFYVLAAVGSAYFLVRQREFDFFTIGFASGVVYFLPGFFGFVRSSGNYSLSEPLQPQSYLVFISVLLCVLLGAYVFDQLVPGGQSDSKRVIPLQLTTEMAIGVAIFGLIATLLASGADLFSSQKADVIESTGRWHILFRFASIYLLVFAVVRKQRMLVAVGILLLLFDLFIGFRMGVVIGALAAATIIFHRRGVQSLIKSERRSLVFGVLLIAVIFIYKRIYTVIKLGLWDTVVARLSDPDILAIALMTSEPFGTQSILNEVIRTDFHISAAHLSSVATLLVPFSNLLGAEIQSFNSLFQERLFGGVVQGGMAANIWAQMYAIGGWFGLGIGIPVYVAFLGLGSWLLRVSKGSIVVLVAVTFTFLAFYIHRNDVLFMLVLLRRCLIVWIVMVIPGMLLVDARRVRRAAKPTAAAP